MTLIPATHFPARRIALAFSILTVLLSMLVASHPVIAGAIIYVDTTAGGANNGTSWGNAFTDLLTAISAASPGDELWIAEGAYHPAEDRYSTFLIDKNLTLLGGFPPGGDLSSRDPDLHPTVLSGDIGVLSESSDNVYHVVTVKGLGVTVLLDGLTISDAYGNDATAKIDDMEGGGIFAEQVSLTLTHIKIENNRTLYGAAIYTHAGTLQIHNSMITGNKVNDENFDYTFYGGGIHNWNSSVTISDTRFENNIITNGQGGAIFSVGGTLSITGSVFKHNGAIFQQNGAAASDLPLGGAIYNNSTALIVNTEFLSNYSTSTNGKTAGGGAIFNEQGANNSIKIANSIFDANTASNTAGGKSYGGAITSVQALWIWNSTFMNNSAFTDGKAVYAAGFPCNIYNSIFWENSPSSLPYSPGISYCSLYGFMAYDPRFVDPAHGDYHLKYSSVDIDYGDNNYLPTDFLDLDGDGDTSEPLPFDKDGNPRRFDMPVQPNEGQGDPPPIDLGPYERSNQAPVLDNAGSPMLSTAINENGFSSLGDRISEILASSGFVDPITDPDPGAVEGIAVVGADNTNGKWQYSTDGGANWKDFGAVSESSSVLLGIGPTDRIRFVPNPDFCGEVNPGITFRAWDHTDGYPYDSYFQSGTTDLKSMAGVNIFVTGGAAPYSQSAETAGISVTCIPINHPPTFDEIPIQTILEDSPTVTIPLSGIGPGVRDEEQRVTVTAASSDTDLIPDPQVIYTSPDSSGELRFAPAANRNGTVLITITLQDDGGTERGGQDTTLKTFQVKILPVNDPPSFAKGPDITVLEDAGEVIVKNWASSIQSGPPDENNQSVTFKLTSSNDAILFYLPKIDPITGDLSFTTYLNAFGSDQVTVQLKDSGGVLNGGVDTVTTSFQINILPVNDPPSSSIKNYPVVDEDADQVMIPGWVSNIRPGPPNESSQSVSLHLFPDKPELFSVQPEVDLATGDLSFTTAPDAFGSTLVTYRLQDDGGVDNGGIDKVEKVIRFTINPVNDPPILTDFSKDIPWYKKINFDSTDFTSYYQDVENEPLEGIRITSLPSRGTLLLDGKPVELRQNIAVSDLSNLVYVPPRMWSGEVVFTITAHDGRDYSKQDARVIIYVSEYKYKYFVPLLFKRK